MRRVNNNVDVQSVRNRVLQFLQIATNSCHALQSNFINFKIRFKDKNVNGEFLAGFVIQAITGTVEYEDGLRMTAFQGGCGCHCGDVQFRRNFCTIINGSK